MRPVSHSQSAYCFVSIKDVFLMTSSHSAALSTQRGMLFIALAALLWGTVGIATRLVYDLSTTNALSIGFYRLALSVPALALACWLQVRASALRISVRDFGIMALMGIMMALYQVCYFAAIPMVGVSIAVLVTLCMAPVLVAILSAAVIGERPSRSVLIALLCAIIGTALLIGVDGADTTLSGQRLLGVTLALGSALGYAIVTLAGRMLAPHHHPLVSTTYAFAIGALILLFGALTQGLTVDYNTPVWGLLLWLGLVPTALGYVMFLSGMRSTPATVASIITLLEPLVSTLLAMWLFQERLGSYGIYGALLLLSALIVLYTRR